MINKLRENFYNKKYSQYGEYNKDFIVKQWGIGGGYKIETSPYSQKEKPSFEDQYLFGSELFFTDRVKDAVGSAIGKIEDVLSEANAVFHSCWPFMLIAGAVSSIPLVYTLTSTEQSINQGSQSYVIMQNEDGENVLHQSTKEEVFTLKDGNFEVHVDCGNYISDTDVSLYQNEDITQDKYDEVCECVEDETLKHKHDDIKENTETEITDQENVSVETNEQ